MAAARRRWKKCDWVRGVGFASAVRSSTMVISSIRPVCDGVVLGGLYAFGVTQMFPKLIEVSAAFRGSMNCGEAEATADVSTPLRSAQHDRRIGAHCKHHRGGDELADGGVEPGQN